tara:strand:+ start:4873 stop:6099 length:1227 start_codon:yes stop_codon:yes gene_type:complete
MLTRILSGLGYERRATDYNPVYAPDAWGRALRPATYASPSAVLSNLAVATRCVSLRSELLASVPLKLYRRTADGDRERVTDTPLAMVLGDLANSLTTSFEAREFLVRQLDLSGNAYARIERNGNGQVTAIWPIASAFVQVERLESGNRLRYRVTQPLTRGPIVLLQEEMLHIRASSEDGLLGQSPIAIARGALSRAINENETAQNLAANGLRPAGVLEHPGKLSAAAKENIANSAMEQAAGPGRSGRPMVIEEGMKWNATSFTSVDAQFLESREMSNLDVARIFAVPPAALGIQSSVSYGSAAADAQALVQNCLQPLAERVEQALMRCLLTPEGRRTYIIEHDLRGLLRGNMAERFSAYRIGREIGIYSANDVRRAENESAIPDGDSYLQPVTLAGSSAPKDGGGNAG